MLVEAEEVLFVFPELHIRSICVVLHRAGQFEKLVVLILGILLLLIREGSTISVSLEVGEFRATG